MAVVYIGSNAYYGGLVMFAAAIVVIGGAFLFLSTSLLGVFHKVRKEQDLKLVYLLTGMSVFALIHVTMVLSSLMYKAGVTDCVATLKGGTLFYIEVKPLLFLFLARKASLVQYNANATKWVFIIDYVLIGTYFVYYWSILLIPGIISFTHFVDKSNGLGMCLSAASSSLPSGALVFELVLNVLNLYVFLKPLMAHYKESQALGNTMSGNSKLIGEVIGRNMRGAYVSIFFTCFARLFAIFFAPHLNGNFGLLTIVYGMVVLDETVAICCLMYVCHNAWEFPCSQGGASGTSTATSAGKNSENATEVTGQV